MLQLKEQIANHALSGVYLLYGEEQYLIRLYLGKIRKELLTEEEEFMNYSFLEHPSDPQMVIEMIQTLPFLAEKRLVVIKNSGYFKPGESYSALEEELDRLDQTVLVFVESEVDKRSGLYKKIAKSGLAVEFIEQTPEVLVKWLVHEAAANQTQLSPNAAAFMVHYCGTDMTLLSSELNKLLTYAKDLDHTITNDDVRNVCAPSGEEDVFKMTDAMSSGKASSALSIYNELISQGEKPNSIFYMICRQFRLLLRTKIMMREGFSTEQMMNSLSVQGFVLRKLKEQASRFDEETLRQALYELLQLDGDSKNGNIDANDACMAILLKYSKTH